VDKRGRVVWAVCLSFLVVIAAVGLGLFCDDLFVRYQFRRLVLKDLTDPKTMDSLTAFPDTAFRLAKRKLTDGNDGERYTALAVLSKLSDPERVEALCTALTDALPAIRCAAAEILLDLGSEEAELAVLKATEHEDPLVRQSAYWVYVKRFTGRSGLDIIEKALDGDAVRMKYMIINNFCRRNVNLPESLRAKVRDIMRNSEDFATSTIAAKILAKRGEEEAMEFLVDRMKSSLQAVQSFKARDCGYILAEVRGRAILPTLIDFLSETPKEAQWVIVDICSIIVGKEFYEVQELTDWWQAEQQLQELTPAGAD